MFMNARVILVTGANGGLGAAIGRVFLQESDQNHVWLGVRQHREEADALVATCPNRCATVDLDVTSADAWGAAVNGIVGRHGRLDVLINNAGGNEDGLLATMSRDSWQRVLANNLDGTFHGCQAVLPTMIAQRQGRIVNMVSLSALLPPAGQANYAAAKAGIVALTQSLAKEVARIGITVNAVCPGYIESKSTDLMSEDAKNAARSRIPMRRFGRPEEVAAAVRFLACSEASYVTGSVLKIDGGVL
jgi:3-oxoacyl-[acyl-carrier protein] reductase